jgi:hypothetical protein
MRVPRHSSQDIKDVLRNLGTLAEIFNNRKRFGHCGNIAGQEIIPETFHVGIFAARHMGKLGKSFADGLAAKTDAFLGIQGGYVGNEALYIPSPADTLANRYGIDNNISVMLEQFGRTCPMWNDFIV